jgi:hypothetical protein
MLLSHSPTTSHRIRSRGKASNRHSTGIRLVSAPKIYVNFSFLRYWIELKKFRSLHSILMRRSRKFLGVVQLRSKGTMLRLAGMCHKGRTGKNLRAPRRTYLSSLVLISSFISIVGLFLRSLRRHFQECTVRGTLSTRYIEEQSHHLKTPVLLGPSISPLGFGTIKGSRRPSLRIRLLRAQPQILLFPLVAVRSEYLYLVSGSAKNGLDRLMHAHDA